MNKQYYWQKTEKCAGCAFNDDPDACHYYGYRFWPELPLADDCWQFLTPAQWAVLVRMRQEVEDQKRKMDHYCAYWDTLRQKNHPDLPSNYKPPYTPAHVEKD